MEKDLLFLAKNANARAVAESKAWELVFRNFRFVGPNINTSLQRKYLGLAVTISQRKMALSAEGRRFGKNVGQLICATLLTFWRTASAFLQLRWSTFWVSDQQVFPVFNTFSTLSTSTSTTQRVKRQPQPEKSYFKNPYTQRKGLSVSFAPSTQRSSLMAGLTYPSQP